MDQAITWREGFPHLFITAFDMSRDKAGECRSLNSPLYKENMFSTVAVAARHELGHQWKEDIVLE